MGSIRHASTRTIYFRKWLLIRGVDLKGLMELYSKEEIDNLFSETRLINLLMDKYNLIPKKRIMTKNQILVEEGLENERVFYIKQGIVAFTRNESIFNFEQEGHFIGLETFLFNDIQPYTIVAMEKMEVLLFVKEEILDILMGLQEGWLYLYLLNKAEQQRIQKNCIHLHLKGNDRSRKMLADLANNFGKVEGDAIVLPKCFSKKIVISYLGLSFNTGKSLIEKLQREDFLLRPEKEKLFRVNKEFC